MPGPRTRVLTGASAASHANASGFFTLIFLNEFGSMLGVQSSTRHGHKVAF